MWNGSSKKQAWRQLLSSNTDPRSHLLQMARPRAAGSNEESQARAYCAAVLQSNGFSTTEEPFVYSSAVGRLAVPAAGALCFVCLAAATGLFLAGVSGRVLAYSLFALITVLWLGENWLATRGVLDLWMGRTRGVNLVGVRGQPTLWLVAHLDTKSQPIPSLLRAAALVLMTLSLVFAALAALFGLSNTLGAAGAGIGAVAALFVSLSTVGNESPGGVDNASGIASLLSTIQTVPSDVPLGVVFTSAEELGLAGSRAWARARSATHSPGIAVNFDSVDDAGVIRCMVHGHQSRSLAKGFEELARERGRRLVVSGLIPGILTDGVALGDAGWQAITLSRGNIATLARIHRPADTVHSLTGSGAQELAELVAGWILRAESVKASKPGSVEPEECR